MSKRFGRQQKRKMREQLAQAEAKLVERSRQDSHLRPTMLREIRIPVFDGHQFSEERYGLMSLRTEVHEEFFDQPSRLFALLHLDGHGTACIYVSSDQFPRVRPEYLGELVDHFSKKLAKDLLCFLQSRPAN